MMKLCFSALLLISTAIFIHFQVHLLDGRAILKVGIIQQRSFVGDSEVRG